MVIKLEEAWCSSMAHGSIGGRLSEGPAFMPWLSGQPLALEDMDAACGRKMRQGSLEESGLCFLFRFYSLQINLGLLCTSIDRHIAATIMT